MSSEKVTVARSVRKESPATGHTNSQKKPLRPECHNPMAEIRGQRKGRNQNVAQRRSHTLGEDGYPQIVLGLKIFFQAATSRGRNHATQ